MLMEGAQEPAGFILRVSKQIRPLLSMFGCTTGVKNLTAGGSNGYLSMMHVVIA